MSKRAVADTFGIQARKAGFPARSVFKLKEIDSKHRVFRPGQRVLDLGCFPGSWSLYAAQQVGSKGKVVGIDLKVLPATQAFPPWVSVFQQDAFKINVTDVAPPPLSPFPPPAPLGATATASISVPSVTQMAAEFEEKLSLQSKTSVKGKKFPLCPPFYFDVLMSDMAPNTTGIREVDVEASIDLCLQVLALSSKLLKPQGVLLFKIFRGNRWEDVLKRCRREFNSVNVCKPVSSRSESMEVFLLAKGRRRKQDDTNEKEVV